MKIIEPTFIIESDIKGAEILKIIESAGRTAYKSEDKITEISAIKFAKKIIESGHYSVIEHVSITVRLICDRGISHEIVRHRLASYTQESTRYCNYGDGKFGNEITVIRPFFWNENDKEFKMWKDIMEMIEKKYVEMVSPPLNIKPEKARSILPNSLKTEIVVTMNLREWRHFFDLRTPPSAHPQMREITIPLLKEFQKKIPIIFDDILI